MSWSSPQTGDKGHWHIRLLLQPDPLIYEYKPGVWMARKPGPPSGAHKRFLRRLRGDS